MPRIFNKNRYKSLKKNHSNCKCKSKKINKEINVTIIVKIIEDYIDFNKIDIVEEILI